MGQCTGTMRSYVTGHAKVHGKLDSGCALDHMQQVPQAICRISEVKDKKKNEDT